jgi:Amt family ammonium transporter
MNSKVLQLIILSLTAFAFPAFADTGSIDSGDTAFVLISAALVLFMTPGLAFFTVDLSGKKIFLAC